MSQIPEKDIQRAFGKPRSELHENQLWLILQLETKSDVIFDLEHEVASLRLLVTEIVKSIYLNKD